MNLVQLQDTEFIHGNALYFYMLAMKDGEGNGNPLQYSCLENPGDRGAWRAAIYGVEQGRTRLKRRNSSSSNERSEREIKETILFIITSKRMKYLGINLLKDLCSENYKILMKEIKKWHKQMEIYATYLDWKNQCCQKWLYYPRVIYSFNSCQIINNIFSQD